jgi:hypothetical protein
MNKYVYTKDMCTRYGLVNLGNKFLNLQLIATQGFLSAI